MDVRFRRREFELAVFVIFESNPGCCQIPLSTAHGRKTHHNGKLDAPQKRCRASLRGIDPKPPEVSGWCVRSDVCCRREIPGRNRHRKWLVVYAWQQAPPERCSISGSLSVAYRTPRRRSNKRSAQNLPDRDSDWTAAAGSGLTSGKSRIKGWAPQTPITLVSPTEQQ